MDIEVEESNYATQRLLENREITQEWACQEPLVFEEKYVTLHHMDLNKEYKKLLIEKINLKNKKVYEKWNFEIDLQGAAPSKFKQFHEEIGEEIKS